MKTLFTNRKKDIVLALLLTIFFISFAITITIFFKPLYYLDIDYLNITSLSHMSKETIKNNYDILIQYQSLFYQGTLNLPDFVMSTSGRIHFEEVKVIFSVIQITCILSGVLSLIGVYHNIKNKEYRFLKLTSLFSVGIPTVLGFIASLDFDKAFVIFHQIVFRNNYWIFDSRTDPVINILPESFFMHCFMMIIVIVILLSLLCYWYYRRKEKQILEEKTSIL